MMKKHQPYYGAGPEYCQDLSEDIADRLPELDVFELIPENFFGGRNSWFLKELGRAATPVIIHGVELSIGTAAPFKQDHFDEMRRVGDKVNMIAISDHLCMTEAGGIDIGQLTTLPFTDEVIDLICGKLKIIEKQVAVPVVMENIANQFYYPGCTYSETEFIGKILDRTNTHLLLDLHNIHANAFNFGFDPYDWLGQIDLERVWAIHLAGGYMDDDGEFLEDGHSSPVPEEVWKMLAWVSSRCKPPATIVERTSDYPGLDELLAEVRRAKTIVESGVYDLPQADDHDLNLRAFP